MSIGVRSVTIFLFLVLTTVMLVLGQNQSNMDGRTLKFTYSTGTLAAESKRAELRDFVWNRLTNKKQGEIRAAHYGIDGFPTVTEIRIRKDNEGKWYVEVLATKRYGYFGLRKTEIERVRSYEVDRVATVSFEGSGEIPTPIDSNENRDPKLYCVRLRAHNRSDDFIF